MSNKISVSADDEIDIRELLTTLWSGKWLISFVTGAAAVASVVISLMLPSIYTSTTLLAPAEQAGGGMNALLQQYGGIARLAGVQVPQGQGADKVDLALATLQSREFFAGFIDRRDILPAFMAAKSWNPITRELSLDPELYDASTNTWVREVPLPLTPEPSTQEAYEQFIGTLTVSEDRETGLIRISLKHRSPDMAAQWLGWLVEDLNTSFREKEIRQANESIIFLKTQVESTSLADLQTLFFELIQQQTETKMLASVRKDFVLETIDPPVAPEKRTSPRRALICIIGTLFGGFCAVVLRLFLVFIGYRGMFDR